MSLPALPLADAADIVRLVGRASFERGQSYFRSDAVEEFEWDPQLSRLSGLVQGSESRPYECSVTLVASSTKRGYSRPVFSECSCPVEKDCKHVAAVLLSCNAAHLLATGSRSGSEPGAGGGPVRSIRKPRDGEVFRIGPDEIGPDAEKQEATGTRARPAPEPVDLVARRAGWRPRLTPAAPPAAPAANAADAADSATGARADAASDRNASSASETEPDHDPPAEENWKLVLGSIASAAEPSGFDDFDDSLAAARARSAKKQVNTPMALQFELREDARLPHDRWRRSTTRPATSSASSRPKRLGVRPVIRSAAGGWVRANVTWSSFAHQLNRLALSVEQSRWFAELAAVHRATRSAYTSQEPDWIYLDDFASPLLWHLLREAQRLDIPLVGAKRDAVVTIGTLASVSVDASTAPSGELRLSAEVSIDGHAHPLASTGSIGDHGLYAVQFEAKPVVVLAPTADPLTEEQRRLLEQSEPLVVPAPDTAEFFAEYYPRLRRVVEVTSSDASVRLPEVAVPVLVVTATFAKAPAQTLRLGWHWQYGKDAAARFPLTPTADDTGRRDPAAEAVILARTAAALRDASEPGSEWDLIELMNSRTELRDLDAAEFTERALSRFGRLDGVRVDVVGVRPEYRELTETPHLVVTTVETDKHDWFDLGVIVTVDGKKVPFEPLFSALSKGKTKLLLIDNSYLSLKQPVFDRLHELIEEAQNLAEWETGVPKISRYQAGLWADFEDLADESAPATTWRDTASALTSATGVEAVPVPNSVQATLRPYQLDGFSWLAFLWKNGLGGILADDMGLGKTLQTLALIAHAAEQTPGKPPLPFLVVAPTSVVSNWVAEAKRFTPHLVAREITATQAKSGEPLSDAVAGAHIVVTSYALFRLDFEAYQKEEWAGLILDEAQFAKNRASRLNQCAKDFVAPVKFAITGTPMENNLFELWSLFSIVAPGLFPSARRFTEEYVRPIERGQSPELLARLRRRIRPLMMRRSKELVATELPEKQEQVLQIELAPRHRTLYDTFLQRERQKLLGLIDDLDRNRFIVFRSLTLLRMLSLDASLVDEKYAGIPSGKLDALLEQLDDVVAEGHRALVFSQFTSFLKLAASRLEERGIRYSYLDGSSRRRSEIIDDFKTGEAPVFLISLKAGGVGLNLTEADYVFLLDPWWNPATESQAIDRSHRIGQTKNVMVYRLVATGTIEEKVMALKERKAALTDAVLDDEAAFSSALTADDIRGLFDE